MSAVTPVSKPVHTSKPSTFDWISNHWFGIFVVVYGLWVFAPFFAPVFMRLGWNGAGKAIYLIYSFFCHQLPERSFFLFGQKTMYSLGEIQAAWQNTANPMVLRRFIGNETMGWKIAWSDRMISFYTSVWLFAVLWWPFRKKMKPLPWWAFVLLLLPLALDGGSHAVSDIAGIGLGFRDSNQWLAALTNNIFPATFYAGDALGSFNSWARFITGVLAGLAIAWLAFPFLYQSQELNKTLASTNSYGAVLEQIKNKDPNPSGR
jgi:uncharacterized membrane protein